MQRIAEIMTRDVTTVSPEENIQRAAQLMDELNVGALPVCENEKLVGMITDRDITVRVTSAAESPENTKVREVMSSDVIWCNEDQSVEEVMEQMANSQVRRVPVIDRNNQQLIGIATLGDLASKQSGAASGMTSEQIHQTMSGISQPSEPSRPQGNP